MKKYLPLTLFLFLVYSCTPTVFKLVPLLEPNITILGIAQDAGFPQANCKKECCAKVWAGAVARKRVSCIALVDPQQQKAWIFDATPDFKDQWYELEKLYPEIELAGIFLTHAHMGHYTGLMHLGREAVGSKSIPVYAMPKMRSYLRENGPWSQLVQLKNIELRDLTVDSTVVLGAGYAVSPLLVPHRDEYSETVGFRIKNKNTSALFIPDIDKWEKWERSILDEIKSVDYALLDGTFYQNGEIPGRDMSLIPHPFVEESMQRFAALPSAEKAKVHFIHFNHTNPLLQNKHPAINEVETAGYNIAQEGQQLVLD